MIALSPRFTFLATLCALAALSSAPISDAAILRWRASDPAPTDTTSTHAFSGAATWLPRRSSRAVGGLPVLPLPEGLAGSQKKYPDNGSSSSGNQHDLKNPSGGERHGEKDAFAGDDTEGPPYDDNGAVPKKGRTAKVKDRRWNPPRPIGLGDSHVYYARAPHHHHGRYRRGLKTGRSEPGYDRDLSNSVSSMDDEPAVYPRHHHKSHEKVIVSGDHDHVRVDHSSRSPHHHHHHHHHQAGNEKVVVSGDHDHVRVDRSPRSPHRHHHHHHQAGKEKVVVSGNHDHVRVDRSPRSPHHHHHHHHHHETGSKKVVISGDHDHVRVDRSPDRHHPHGDEKVITSDENDHIHLQRSVRIAGEQGQSFVVSRVAKRSVAQELFTIPRLGKRADGCAPGQIHIMSPSESGGGELIASLVLASSMTSDNSTTPPPAFVLNASDTNATTMCLYASSSNSSNSALTPNEVGVTLHVEVFDAATASTAQYCATFDPDPPAPAPLTAEECTDDPVGGYKSQFFAFDRVTGVVRPMWFEGKDDERESESNGCTGDVDGAAPQDTSPPSVAGVDGNSTQNTDFTADSSVAARSDSFESSTSGAQTVALVFVANDPEVIDSPAGASTTISPIPAMTTGAETSNTAFTTAGSSTTAMTTASPTVQVAVSSSGSISASTVSSVAPVSATVSSSMPTSVPLSTATVSGTNSTPSMALGVQVVAEPASNTAASTTSATPILTPVNTQPYEWMFKPDSR